MSDAKPAREWLKGKTAADLDLVEFGGRIFFPETIHRLKKGGKFEPVEVVVCVLRPTEKALARRDAKRFAERWQLDREKDADQFEIIDIFARLSHAIRTKELEHGQAYTLDTLVSNKPDEGFDERSLLAVWERIRVYEDLIDPNIVEPMSEEEVLQTAYAIDRVRNLTPLAATGGRALDSCVIGMASILCKYQTLLLNSQSTANLTQEP